MVGSPRILITAAIAALACSCAPVAPPPTAPGGDHREFPAYPAGPAVPTNAELARLLATGVPERDRAAAIGVLVDEILPWDLRDLPATPRGELSAQAIVRAAYGTLASQLAAVAPDQRRARLATLACHRRALRTTGRATALAVARYVADRGKPRTNLVIGYLDEARPYLAMTVDEQRAEADRLDGELAAFESSARGDAECRDRERDGVEHARHALAVARSGEFDGAMGPLYVFLRNAGARPRRLAPH